VLTVINGKQRIRDEVGSRFVTKFYQNVYPKRSGQFTLGTSWI
jgi:hypothetical protein